MQQPQQAQPVERNQFLAINSSNEITPSGVCSMVCGQNATCNSFCPTIVSAGVNVLCGLLPFGSSLCKSLVSKVI